VIAALVLRPDSRRAHRLIPVIHSGHALHIRGNAAAPAISGP